MEFTKVLSSRRMVRSYSDAPVAGAVVQSVVDAGLQSPSAGFSQGVRCIVVTDPSTRSEIAAEAGEAKYVERGFEPWLSSAPVLVVLCVDPGAYEDRYAASDKAGSTATDPSTGDWIVPYWWVDAGASLMAMLLAATDEGLAAGFLGAHACGDTADLLGIPHGVELVGIVSLGHGAPDRASSSVARGRRDRADMVFKDRWAAGP
ncbi:MAG: nitroreductase family protein [Acidimicrobiia bacterium]